MKQPFSRNSMRESYILMIYRYRDTKSEYSLDIKRFITSNFMGKITYFKYRLFFNLISKKDGRFQRVNNPKL